MASRADAALMYWRTMRALSEARDTDDVDEWTQAQEELDFLGDFVGDDWPVLRTRCKAAQTPPGPAAVVRLR